MMLDCFSIAIVVVVVVVVIASPATNKRRAQRRGQSSLSCWCFLPLCERTSTVDCAQTGRATMWMHTRCCAYCFRSAADHLNYYFSNAPKIAHNNNNNNHNHNHNNYDGRNGEEAAGE